MQYYLVILAFVDNTFRPLTHHMLIPKNYPLCEAFVKEINNNFISGGWIVLNSPSTGCALVSDDTLPTCLQSYVWDLPWDDARPQVTEFFDERKPQLQKNKSGLFPFIYQREPKGNYCRIIEIIEHFRLLYDLRVVNISTNESEYVQVDECGDDVSVIKIKDTLVQVSVKYLFEYMALRELNLLVFFDFMNYSPKTYAEQGIEFKENRIELGDNYCLNYSNILYPEGYGQSGGWLMGKIALRFNSGDIKHLWSPTDETYEEFIYKCDERGNELLSTCDEEQLSNLFVKKPGDPLTLTPIFFKKEVLDKYYANPNKYSVNDGGISGPTWRLPIDNDRNDNRIAVLLYHLGRIPHKEQLHWKQFNIAPLAHDGVSKTAWNRWFEGRFCDCKESVDLVLKNKLSTFSEKWYKINGWYLFKPLNPKDEFYLTNLHCLTVRDNDKDFESQILALTKVFIDSLNVKGLRKHINESNEAVIDYVSKSKKESLSQLSGSITLFEAYSLDKGIYDKDAFDFLRNVQNLRSMDIAHRKTSNDKERLPIIQYFKLDTLCEQDALNSIFATFIRLLNELEKNVETIAAEK